MKTKLNYDDEMRTHVPSMFVSEDDSDEVEYVDTGRVDKHGEPIVIALSHKQGFAGFIPPGEWARMQQRKEEEAAKAELFELVETIITSTLLKLGVLKKPEDRKPSTAETAAKMLKKKKKSD